MCNLVCFIACFAACEPGITAQLLRTPEGRDFVFRAVERNFSHRTKVHSEFQRVIKLSQAHWARGDKLSNELRNLLNLPSNEETQKLAAALVVQYQQHNAEAKKIDKEWEKLESLLKSDK